MNVETLELVFKRINIEENIEVKHHMINALELALQVEAAQLKLKGAQPSNEVLVEIEEREVMDSNTAEIDLPEESLPVEDVITEDPAAKQEAIQSLVSVIENVKESEQETLDLGDIEEVQAVEPIATEDTSDATAPTSPAVVEPILAFFKESFGLLNPTTEEHLNELLKGKAALFLNKKTYMLGLSLENEVLAFAKTQKISNLPYEVQDHLKENGFVSADVHAIGEIVKKSRARLVDITFKNFELLPADHQIAVNVTNFLETGVVPKDKEEVKEEVAPAVVENFVSQTYTLNPVVVQSMTNRKDFVLEQKYILVVEGALAKLMMVNPNDGSLAPIAINDKSTLEEGKVDVQILDYALEIGEGNRAFATFKLSFTQEEAAVTEEVPEIEEDPEMTARQYEEEYEKEIEAQEQTPVAKAERDQSVNLTTIGDVPADFPSKRQITLQLHPYAEKLLTPEKAQELIGEPMNLRIINNPDGTSHIGLMDYFFEMAISENSLTQETMRDSKWIAKVSKIDLIPDDSKRKFVLIVEFDYLVEYPHFTFENQESPLDVKQYRAITEESYLASLGSAVPKEEPKPTPEVKPAEKVYDQNAGKLLEPNPSGNYGGAVESISNRSAMTVTSAQAVMERANEAIAGAINKTQQETSIHLTPQNVQPTTTEVMGNIQDGAGVLSKTSTVVPFVTGWEPATWYKVIGRKIQMKSEWHRMENSDMKKAVKILGKDDGGPVAQAVVPTSEALFMDGNHHQAEIIGVDKITVDEPGKRYIVHLVLGDFKKLD